jgi:maleate cis-trans isomerase
MAYTSWRGVIGCIKPSLHAGTTEDLIRLLPEGIGVIPLHIDVPIEREKRKAGVVLYEDKVRELAEQEVDLVLAEGSGPFMLQGYKGERDLIRGWEKKYGVAIVTSGQNHVNALRAMKIKRLVCVRPSIWAEDKKRTATYLRDAGFEPLAIESPAGYGIERVGEIPSELVYGIAKKAYLQNPKAEGIYFLGSAMRVGDIAGMLERDLGIPVVAAITARCWEVQKRLHVHQPLAGYGRLLSELP